MNRTTISTQNRFATLSDASVKISEKDFQAFEIGSNLGIKNYALSFLVHYCGV